MLEWQEELKDAKDFMESLKIDLFIDEVFVFTPKGAVFDLPIGATPVDFAYRVHTEVGHRTVGARVNGRLVPLDFKLRNGDIIEIVTGKKDAPSRDWLRFVRTAGAKVKIRNWFKRQLPTEKEVVEQLPVAKEAPVLPAVAAPRPRGRGKSAIKVSGLENVLVRFSKCCHPIPGEKIIGYVTLGKGVSIHRSDCHNVVGHDLAKDKLVKVSWNLDSEMLFPAEIEIESFDRVGVFKDILNQISETKTNVAAAKVKTKRGNSAFLDLTVDVRDKDHLDRVIAAIKKVSDVYDVKR
jgi:GTP pyrophosphokinase